MAADVPRPVADAIRNARSWLAVGVVLLLPLIGLPREDQREGLPAALSYLYVADILFIALGLLSLPAVGLSMRRRPSLESALWIALYGLLFIAFVVHPSDSGLDRIVRLMAAAGLYRTVADAEPGRRRWLAAALGATAGVQALVAVGQFANGAPLGLAWLGEIQADLSTNRGPPSPRGTLGHEYILAVLSILSATILSGEGLRARRPWPWLLGAAVAVSAAGLSFGRAAAASFGMVLGAFALGARRSVGYRWVLACLLIGFGVTAVAGMPGWTNSFGRGLSSERVQMVEQAAEIVEVDPVFGVGPGNYLDVLRSRPELHTTSDVLNVHSVPALLAAEAGVPAGLLSILLLFVLGLRAFAARPIGLTLYGSFFLWAILDVLPYVTPQGIVLTAVWLGFMDHARRDPRPSLP